MLCGFLLLCVMDVMVYALCIPYSTLDHAIGPVICVSSCIGRRVLNGSVVTVHLIKGPLPLNGWRHAYLMMYNIIYTTLAHLRVRC